MILRNADGDVQVTFEETGSYIVVPKGRWHTAKVSGPTRMLFITPGEGTEHSDNP